MRAPLSLGSLPVLLLSLGCGSAAPPPAEPPAPPPAAAPEPEPAVEAPPPEPTEEERQAAEEAARREAEWAAMEAKARAEAERWTPELRAEAAKLAEKKHPSTRAGLNVLLKSPHRAPGNPDRDAHRRPLQTLEFFGLQPTHTVLEYGPGEGWYTELLAPLLAARGKLIVTTGDPNGPREVRDTYYGRRFQLFLEKSPELFGKVETVTVESRAPSMPLDGTVDVALVIRGMHGWHRNGTTAAWLKEIHEALKPRGVLGIVQHRAAPDANPDEAAPRGYLPEAFVVEEVQKAGFKLSGKSEINANPKDTKDHPEGVWNLPPNYRHGDENREHYAAIGESDRMTLKFVKVAVK
jgi:predicted methyltransferase